MSDGISIRAAEPGDVPLLFSLVLELAEFEHAREHVTGSVEMLKSALFGADAVVEAVLAEAGYGEVVGGEGGRSHEVAGFALFYTTFSTWQCLPGIWLEDLYVSAQHRRGGVGRALLRHVAAIAVDRGSGRLEWAALDWNTPALEFYKSLGASIHPDWHIHRLEGSALREAAGVG